jgi:CBS domain-containing protein
MFGGLARMKKDSPTPWIDFKIAAAGPAVTALIAAICFLAGVASGISPGDFVDTMFLNASNASPGQVVVADVCAINVALLVFNLLPGLPLDGGRIVRAIAWWRTGDRNRATHIMAQSGRGLAWVIGAGGAWLALNGAIASGIWLVFIAAFIIGPAARAAEASTVVASRIEGLRVSDVMDSEPVAVPAEASVERALDDFFLRYRWDWFPVVDATGHFVGLVERQRVDDAASDAQVGDVVQPETQTTFRVGVDEPLETLLRSEGLQRLGAIMAVDGEGVLRGVVTVEQVARALQPFARIA